MHATRIIAALALVATPSIAVVGNLPPVAAGTALAASSTTIVVDDDGAQCAGADYSSIADAVRAVPAGGTVEVCPGLYRERVAIHKPLHLIGQRDAVAAIDCFDPTWTTATPLDTSILPVLERPLDDVLSETPAPLVRLSADGVEVAGLAVRTMAQPVRVDQTYTPAIQADGAHAGNRIHDNLVQGNDLPRETQDNTFGIEVGNDGRAESRVDHNCLRGNTWAIGNQRNTAASVRIDHNDAYRQGFVTFELGPAAPASAVRLDHNHSMSVGFYAYSVENSDQVRVDDNVAKGSRTVAFRVQNSTSVRLDHNEANGGVGVQVLSGNNGMEISANQLTGGGTIGITIPGGPAPLENPSTGLVVDGNSVHGYASNGISMGPNANTSGVVISDNLVSGNGQAGIQVGPTNTGASVQGNTSDGNGVYGIRTGPGARGNLLIANSMHDNARADASEGTVNADGTLGNTWSDNLCLTDEPAWAAICPAP